MSQRAVHGAVLATTLVVLVASVVVALLNHDVGLWLTAAAMLLIAIGQAFQRQQRLT